MIGEKCVTINDTSTGRLLSFETLGNASASPVVAEIHAKLISNYLKVRDINRTGQRNPDNLQNEMDNIREGRWYLAPIPGMTRHIAGYGATVQNICASVMSDLTFVPGVEPNIEIVSLDTLTGSITGEHEKLGAGLLLLALKENLVTTETTVSAKTASFSKCEQWFKNLGFFKNGEYWDGNMAVSYIDAPSVQNVIGNLVSTYPDLALL